MANTTALLEVRAFSALATGTEAVPTASSAWVTPDDFHPFSKAKFFFGIPTIGGSGTPTVAVRLWGKQGSVIVPLGLSTLADGQFPVFDAGTTPVRSFYATGVISGGTAPTLTGSVYVTMYNDWEA